MQAGFVTFELSFHVSYYTLRLSTKNDQSPRTIALLSTNLYEAQVSLTVVGISNNRWTSYCLVRVSDDDIDLTADEGSSDSGYGDEEWGWHECETPSEGISNTKTDDSSIKDPRKYWLESVRARMHSVVEEWRHIVCTLETIVQVQNVRHWCAPNSLTNNNTKPDSRSSNHFRSLTPSPKTLRTDFRALVLIR